MRKYLTLPNQPDREGALLFLGSAYENLRQYDTAADTYRTLLGLTRDRGMTFKAEYELGHSLRMGDHYAAAIDELQKAENLEVSACDASGACADSENLRANLGLSFYKLQRYSEALAAFQEAAQLKPDDSDNDYFLGMTYVRMGRRAEALAEYQRLLPLNKDNAADLYAEIQKMGETASAPTPKPSPPARPPSENANAFATQCKSQVDAQDYADAIDICKKAVAAAPFSADAWSNLGMANFGSKHYADAAQAYEQVIRLRPNDARAHYGIGAAYEEMKQYDKAIPPLREAVRLDPSSANQWYDLGQCLYLVGQFLASAQALEKSAELQPNDSATDYWLGRAYVKLGKKEQSIAAYKRLVGPDENKNEKLSQQLLAEINAAKTAAVQPQSPAANSSQQPPAAAHGNASYADQCLKADKSGDLANVVSVCGEAVRVNPGDAGSWALLGSAYARLNRYTEAVQAFQESARLDPDLDAAWFGLGVTYYELGRYANSAQAMERVVRMNPTAEKYQLLGRDYVQMGKRTEANAIYKKLLPIDKEAAEDLRQFMMQMDAASTAKQQSN